MSDASSPPLISAMRGRLWRVGGLAALTAAALWTPSLIARAVGVEPVIITMAGTLLGCLVLLLAVVSLRCPSCGMSLCWHAVSKHSVGQWLNWLLDVQECPTCHYRIDNASVGSRPSSDPSP